MHGYGRCGFLKLPNVHRHKPVIEQVLSHLKHGGEILKFKRNREMFTGNSLFYRLTLYPGDEHGLLLEFRLPSARPPKSQRSSGFSEVVLPAIFETLSAHDLREQIRQEVRSRKKGRSGEQIVLSELHALIGAGKDFLNDAYKSRNREDMGGSDIILKFIEPDGTCRKVGLQVKSSRRGQTGHRARYPNIPSICDAPFETLGARLKQLVAGLKNNQVLHL